MCYHDVQAKCTNLLIFYFAFSFHNRCYLLYLLALLQAVAFVLFALVKVAAALVFPPCSQHCQDRVCQHECTKSNTSGSIQIYTETLQGTFCLKGKITESFGFIVGPSVKHKKRWADTSHTHQTHYICSLLGINVAHLNLQTPDWISMDLMGLLIWWQDFTLNKHRIR